MYNGHKYGYGKSIVVTLTNGKSRAFALGDVTGAELLSIYPVGSSLILAWTKFFGEGGYMDSREFQKTDITHVDVRR